ncbi:hypothetical protein B808_394 [Fructilactobacillus florum 8D]|uniref:Uncharacterized protein n=1 Tax=Fructilactobacillus florum 8D TaxID=1221538 RepID=W9EF73_9LACO|nr:hypothetical protein [Fructilactobacillus florum]EKK21142.1 hypothetical protein B807_118 [Fructilactobacillus florum 2F]ETO40732.1 hypothetical protein B808_394 [Fructilactobacillus florum 8D]
MDNSTELRKFVYDDDKYHKIKNVTINYFSVRHNPMGRIDVGGYVNGQLQTSQLAKVKNLEEQATGFISNGTTKMELNNRGKWTHKVNEAIEKHSHDFSK